MNLHEYQAKELLAGYGLPVQGGILAANGEEAAAAFDKLGGKFAVIKAQVHAGGRGKAGGVKVVKSRDEAKQVAESLIGTNLITYQTDANGQPVNSVLVCEDMYPVQTELYLGAVVDRAARRVVFMKRWPRKPRKKSLKPWWTRWWACSPAKPAKWPSSWA